MLDREAEIFSSLPPHPNILKYYTHWEEDSKIYILMELCEGNNLIDFIYSDTNLLQEAKVRQILLEILRALYFMHKHHIAHRDIKPGNIMLTKDGQCKIGDYGCAKQYKPNAVLEKAETNTACTEEYQSPERLRSD